MGIQYRLEASEFLAFKIEQKVKYLYIDFLRSLEQLVEDEYISEEHFQRLRDRVLNAGNGAIRELIAELEKFEVTP